MHPLRGPGTIQPSTEAFIGEGMSARSFIVLPVLLLLSTVADVCASSPVEVIVYPSFGFGSTATIEGRVIAHEARDEHATEDGKRENLERNLQLLINKEIADVKVTVSVGQRTWDTVTDAEGYFRIDAHEENLLPAGWHAVSAQAPAGTGSGSLLMVPAGNVQGVISDFDDTVVVSEVNRFFRLLGHSLLKNPQQREAVPGMAEQYARLIAGNPDASTAPLFYLSASPRQLQSPIQSFLDYNGFPRGVLITKRVTNDTTSEPLRDQIRYKSEKLADILERLPDVTFTLFGDDGEHDPEIYHALRQRYPDRISAIWIRRVHPDPQRVRIDGQGDVAELLKQQ